MPKDESDPNDPMEFVAVGLPSDAAGERRMAECFVEEFLMMGFSRERLLGLFRNPQYRGTYAMFEKHGEHWVNGVIDGVASRWKVVRG